MQSTRLDFLYPYKGTNCTYVSVIYNEQRNTVDLLNDYNELMFRGFNKDKDYFIEALENKYFA
jgi:hypothetical protein